MRQWFNAITFLSIISIATVSYAGKMKGTAGDDDLVIYATSGEPAIAQDYENGGTGPNGEEIREDPANEINQRTRTFFKKHPIRQGRTKVWGYGGADNFVVHVFISGKPHVVVDHVNDDGTVEWGMNGVAGENVYVHDHWVDYFGTVIIKDFNAAEGDTLEVVGHTVSLKQVDVKDGGTIFTIQSQQGNGGGAHDEDVLGYIVVKNTELTANDITFTRQDDGIMETFDGYMSLVKLYEKYGKCRRNKRCKKVVKRRIANTIMRDKQ